MSCKTDFFFFFTNVIPQPSRVREITGRCQALSPTLDQGVKARTVRTRAPLIVHGLVFTKICDEHLVEPMVVDGKYGITW